MCRTDFSAASGDLLVEICNQSADWKIALTKTAVSLDSKFRIANMNVIKALKCKNKYLPEAPFYQVKQLYKTLHTN